MTTNVIITIEHQMEGTKTRIEHMTGVKYLRDGETFEQCITDVDSIILSEVPDSEDT